VVQYFGVELGLWCGFWFVDGLWCAGLEVLWVGGYDCEYGV